MSFPLQSLAQPAVANATASVTQTYQGIEKESKDLIEQRMRERESGRAHVNKEIWTNCGERRGEAKRREEEQEERKRK
jgi:hypothetical protein